TVCIPVVLPHTALPAISPLSLHDALPISERAAGDRGLDPPEQLVRLLDPGLGQDHRELVAAHAAGDVGRAHHLAYALGGLGEHRDRKSTRLNSSHQIISYAVFCLKKKKN